MGRFYLVTMLLTLLPYLLGWSLAFGRFYTAYHYNLDDFCVYTAWMEQARRGHFFFDNRFTTDPQPRKTVHLLFWILGTFARLTGLPHPLLIHLARFGFGMLFLWACHRLACLTLADAQAQRYALWLLVVSSGFGWLFWQDTGWDPPADVWQPELTTFPSLYLNPLFLAALWLIGEIWLCLLQMDDALAQNARKAVWKRVAWGALLTLILGNIHTYDLVTIAGVAVGTLGLRWVLSSRPPLTVATLWFLVGLGALPSLLWLAHVYSVDPVFQARAATLTFSPPIWKYLLGYGLVLIGAIVGFFYALRGNPLFTVHGRTLLPAWALIGFLLPYLPVLFQRKLIMGLHLPLCLLSAGALVILQRRFQKPSRYAVLFLLLTIPTNLGWVWRDLRFLAENRSNTQLHTPYLAREDAQLLAYLRDLPDIDSGVLAMPHFAVYIAAFSGHPVYAGHWSETPKFPKRFQEVLRFYDSQTSDAWRREFLQRARVRYLVVPTDLSQPLVQLPGRTLYWANLDALGTEVYRNQVWRVLAVERSTLSL